MSKTSKTGLTRYAQNNLKTVTKSRHIVKYFHPVAKQIQR